MKYTQIDFIDSISRKPAGPEVSDLSHKQSSKVFKDEGADELKHLSLDQIRVNPYQPRREFADEELEELARSIRTVGLLHPPLVRALPEAGLYELVSGERRYRAAQIASLHVIPVYVRSTSYEVSAQAALIENIQRVDLNPIEIARALKRLSVEFGLTQERLAEQIGKKRSTLANYLRLLSLPPAIQESLYKGFITMGHAKAILALDQEEKQILLHEMILRDELNVRETERAAHRISNKPEKRKGEEKTPDFFLTDLENRVREKLGTQVSIQGEGSKGKITIDYYSLDDLDRLLHLFGITEEL